MSTVHSGLRHKLRIQFSKNVKLQEKYDRLEKAALKLRDKVWQYAEAGCIEAIHAGPDSLSDTLEEFDEAIKQDGDM